MIALPAYIDPEAWAGFVEMRKSGKDAKRFTTRAAVLILYELQRLKDAGHDPNACLDQSVRRGWTDVWPLQEKKIERKTTADEFEQGRRQFEEWKNRTPEQKEAADEARRAAVEFARSAIKRVG